ncbi:MAG TPA: hypothetical protein GX708_03885 [Gallicola sp.]|nr:hypothetical protein [Gallicola sp.]
MKRIFSILCLFIVLFTLAGCNDAEIDDKGNDGKNPDVDTPVPFEPVEKHLILDENGNYGGSIDTALYGPGAPLNGEFDILESEYYAVNDFYNMTSTTERTIYTNFAPYQQRMADSSGLATALMILNHLGEDVYEEYTELELLNMYEDLNSTTVYGNGTSAEGLVKLFKEIGYEAEAGVYSPQGSTSTEQIFNFNIWIEEQLKKGRYVMVRYQDTRSFSWNVIIGYDGVGMDYARNSTLIMADPYDIADHYQDGYKISPSGRFFRWWRNVELDGTSTDLYDCVVVHPKTAPFIMRFEDEKEIVQTVPERHLILNADGSFGGTTDAEKYGAAAPANEALDVLHSTYFKFIDYYNMTSEGSRYLLPNYRAFQQTMASSCGISSVLSVLNYYGEDTNIYNEVYLVENYERINNSVIRGSGVGWTGLRNLLKFLGYSATGGSFARERYVNVDSKLFPTYEGFVEFVQGHISNGTPIPVSWRPHGGHWVVIIGIDTMGTDNIYDDVIVFADSSDGWDHYRDGYVTQPAMLFFRQWYNGSMTYNQQHVVFERINN